MAEITSAKSLLQRAKDLITKKTKRISTAHVREKYKVLHVGWLRKRTSKSITVKWRWYYMIVTDHNIFYYNEPESTSFVGKISLYGYNQVRRTEESEKNNSFLLEHASRDPSFEVYYFSASSSQEQLSWMMLMRNALKVANEQVVASINSVDEENFDELEQPIYELEDLPSNSQREDDTIDSDPEDYEKIDEDELNDMIIAKGGSFHKSATLQSNASSDMGYSDFDSPNSKLAKEPPRPRLPTPEELKDCYKPRKPSKPLPELPLPATPAHRKPAVNEPQTLLVSELEALVSKKLDPDSGPSVPLRPPISAKPTIPYMSDLVSSPAPLAPPVPYSTLPSYPAPETESKRKPTLPVKPTRRQEKIFWNGDKAEATRLLANSDKGVFLVRLSSTEPNQMVLAVASGEGSVHAVKIYNYENGCVGVKREVVSSPDDFFDSVYSLIGHFRTTALFLREASLKLNLTKPHELAEQNFNQ